MSETPIGHASASDPVDTGENAATRLFFEHRRLLFSVVYNLLGSIADTEEVLQETWLAWTRQSNRLDAEEIENPRAYLVRVAVNQALTQQSVISRRRETYVGPWLPEPIVANAAEADVAESASHAESVSMALLVILETLSPLERAVFVLHEAFGYQHTEIADILDRKPQAIRQIAHRARKHVEARRPRYQPDRKIQERVTERFISAALGGDMNELMKVLAPDVSLCADGGGKAPAPGKPIQGREKVARLFAGFAMRPLDGLSMHYRLANGDPSVLLLDGDAPWFVLILDLTPDGDQIRSIYGISNPDKLSRIIQP